MTLPFGLGSLTLPDWLPWWVPAVLLIPALIYGLLLLMVPFGVFGVKPRLEAIETRLDDLQAELRSLLRHVAAAEDFAPRPPAPSLVRAEPVEPQAERVRLVSSAPVARPVPMPVPAPRADSRPARAEPRFGAH